MLPRPFPFPFLGNRAGLPPVAQGTGPAPLLPLPPWLGAQQGLVIRNRTVSPGLPGEILFPAPGPAPAQPLPSPLLPLVSPAPPVHSLPPLLGASAQTQPFPGPLLGRRSRPHSGAAACLPLPPSGWAPRALSPATQKSPGAFPQGICFVSFRSAPSGTAALPAGAWAAPPPGSRCRPPPRRSTR